MPYQESDLTDLKCLLSVAEKKLHELRYSEMSYLGICRNGFELEEHIKYFEDSKRQLNTEITRLQKEIRRCQRHLLFQGL